MTDYLIVLVLGVIALGAVAFPLLVGRDSYPDRATLDSDVQRYRDALEAGTVCDHCRQANPPASAYCQDCGQPLE